MMTFIVRHQRLISWMVLPILFILLIDMKAYADVNPMGEEVQGTNVRWTVKDDIIVITYDLNFSADDKYKVDVVMKRENDNSFVAIPATVEGDVGEGYFGGQNREIRWYYRRDFPQGFTGEGYYFEIRVEALGGGSGILYYALGAAAIAGGVLAFVLGSEKSGGAASPLPTPPDRPVGR